MILCRTASLLVGFIGSMEFLCTYDFYCFQLDLFRCNAPIVFGLRGLIVFGTVIFVLLNMHDLVLFNLGWCTWICDFVFTAECALFDCGRYIYFRCRMRVCCGSGMIRDAVRLTLMLDEHFVTLFFHVVGFWYVTFIGILVSFIDIFAGVFEACILVNVFRFWVKGCVRILQMKLFNCCGRLLWVTRGVLHAIEITLCRVNVGAVMRLRGCGYLVSLDCKVVVMCAGLRPGFSSRVVLLSIFSVTFFLINIGSYNFWGWFTVEVSYLIYLYTRLLMCVLAEEFASFKYRCFEICLVVSGFSGYKYVECGYGTMAKRTVCGWWLGLYEHLLIFNALEFFLFVTVDILCVHYFVGLRVLGFFACSVVVTSAAGFVYERGCCLVVLNLGMRTSLLLWDELHERVVVILYFVGVRMSVVSAFGFCCCVRVIPSVLYYFVGLHNLVCGIILIVLLEVVDLMFLAFLGYCCWLLVEIRFDCLFDSLCVCGVNVGVGEGWVFVFNFASCFVCRFKAGYFTRIDREVCVMVTLFERLLDLKVFTLRYYIWFLERLDCAYSWFLVFWFYILLHDVICSLWIVL
eukprot:gene3338-2320_t